MKDFLVKNRIQILIGIIIILVAIIGTLHTLVIPGGSILDEPCCAGLEPGDPFYEECQQMSAAEKLIEKCFGLEE